MDIRDAIRGRASIRAFSPDVPTREEISALIELAVAAPSAANRQFWSFCVISNRALLNQISENAKAYMTATRPLALPDHLYDKLADPRFHVFYDAPVVIVISARSNAPWNAEDCALAAQNLMLGAVELDLGTCWIGLCQPYLATPEGRRLVGFDDDETPLAPIILGRPASTPNPTPRQPPKLRWMQ